MTKNQKILEKKCFPIKWRYKQKAQYDEQMFEMPRKKNRRNVIKKVINILQKNTYLLYLLNTDLK